MSSRDTDIMYFWWLPIVYTTAHTKVRATAGTGPREHTASSPFREELTFETQVVCVCLLEVRGTYSWLHNCSYTPLIRPPRRLSHQLYVSWASKYAPLRGSGTTKRRPQVVVLDFLDELSSQDFDRVRSAVPAADENPVEAASRDQAEGQSKRLGFFCL